MRVLIMASSARPSVDAHMVEALADTAAEGGFEAEIVPEPQDLCSALYRDPAAMGVVWTDSAGIACVICRNWRQAGVRNLLFVLLRPSGEAISVTEAAEKRIQVLGNGADDVQPAPINSLEFVARLAALSRRDRAAAADAVVTLPAGASFNADRGTIIYPGGVVMLTQKEASVLELLTLRPGIIVTKEMVMNYLYGGLDEPQIKIVDVFICKLRKKLENAIGKVDVIQTVWGRGYQFVQEGFEPTLTDSRMRVAG